MSKHAKKNSDRWPMSANAGMREQPNPVFVRQPERGGLIQVGRKLTTGPVPTGFWMTIDEAAGMGRVLLEIVDMNREPEPQHIPHHD